MEYRVYPTHGLETRCKSLKEAKQAIKNMADGAAIFEYYDSLNSYLRYYKVNGRTIKQ